MGRGVSWDRKLKAVLRFLVNPISLGGLARAVASELNMNPYTMRGQVTYIVRVLEKYGYVKMLPHSGPKGAKLYTLTDKGRMMYKTLLEAIDFIAEVKKALREYAGVGD